MVSETGYAESGGVSIAFRVIEGPGPTLVFVPGMLNHIETMWEVPFIVRHLRRLASFSRLVVLDRRGTGQSDALPLRAGPGLDDDAADIVAVIDAVGADSVAVFGTADGAASAIAFAARHPERITHLVLYGATARFRVADDYPIGLRDDQLAPHPPLRWGDPKRPFGGRTWAPSLAADASWLEALARAQRLAASPMNRPGFPGGSIGCFLRPRWPVRGDGSTRLRIRLG